ncbi:MAG: MgtC/SapB family protein [Anaerolineaceae bacterium]|nr:MgtC/SapB family protein [Anaerolineaceae bacterium]
MISELQIILRLLIAAGLGAIIGIERERDNQPAGLRTHMILVVGAALAMCLSINLSFIGEGDPARLAAQVVSGIGFLGAGAILRYGFNVKGLTTATTLWSMAIVGLAIGYGYYLIGVITTAIMLLTLTLVNVIEKKFVRNNVTRYITIQSSDRSGMVKTIRKVVNKLTENVLTFTIQKNVKNKRLRISITAHVRKGEKLEDLTEAISGIDGVRALKIE